MSLGFCGEKYSAEFCYHISEVFFGYDDANTNMVICQVQNKFALVRKEKNL